MCNKHYIIFILLLILSNSTSGLRAQSYLALADSAYRCMEKERFEDAEKFILQALRLEPDNASNHLLLSNLSTARLNLDNPAGALEAAEIGLAMAPKSTQLLVNHSLASLASGNVENSLKSLEKALDVDSIHQRALNLKGQILFSREDYKGASECLNRLISHYPDNPDANSTLGKIKLLEGDAENALQYFTKAADKDPDHENIFYRILTLTLTDRDEEASQQLREALKKEPHYGNFYIVRALLFKKKYQNRESDLNIELAREYNGNESLIYQFFPESVRRK